ncbi:hypothetical protein D3C84_889190 [compost metagenome]
MTAFVRQGQHPLLKGELEPWVLQAVDLPLLAFEASPLPFLQIEGAITTSRHAADFQQQLTLAIPGGGGAVRQLLHNVGHVLGFFMQQLPAAGLALTIQDAEIGLRRVEHQPNLSITHSGQGVKDNDLLPLLLSRDPLSQQLHVQIEQLIRHLHAGQQPIFHHAVHAI